MPITPRIIDESNDKKYFTIVPNYIVNHSSVWEQGVYLVMKRIAGEEGKCFASQREIASRLKVSQQQVSKVIKQLVKRRWIKQEGFVSGKTRPVKCWRIIDLWKLNMDYYNNEKIHHPHGKSNQNQKDNVTTEYKIDAPHGKEEETIGRRNNNSNGQAIAGKELNFLIDSFKSVNPSFERLFCNKTQRDALNRMIRKHGVEKIRWVLDRLPELARSQYAPVVTTPYQLEQKLGQVIIFLGRENKGGGAVDARNVE